MFNVHGFEVSVQGLRLEFRVYGVGFLAYCSLYVQGAKFRPKFECSG